MPPKDITRRITRLRRPTPDGMPQPEPKGPERTEGMVEQLERLMEPRR